MTRLVVLALLAASAALAAAAPAAKKPTGTTPVAFQGSALLIKYYSGVTGVLQEKGVITARTPLAGLSGGALTAVLTALGFSGPAQKAWWTEAMEDLVNTYNDTVR